jgi:uncharacterized phage-like protein YoqJ
MYGLHMGFHSVQWAQERDPDKHGFYQADNPKKQIYAVQEDNIQFQNLEKHFLKEKTDPAAVLMDTSPGRSRRTARTMRRRLLQITFSTIHLIALHQCNTSLM